MKQLLGGSMSESMPFSGPEVQGVMVSIRIIWSLKVDQPITDSRCGVLHIPSGRRSAFIGYICEWTLLLLLSTYVQQRCSCLHSILGDLMKMTFSSGHTSLHTLYPFCFATSFKVGIVIVMYQHWTAAHEGSYGFDHQHSLGSREGRLFRRDMCPSRSKFIISKVSLRSSVCL